MKYTTEQALLEIMRRRDRIVVARNRRACGRLSGAVGALFAALVLVIAVFPGRWGTASVSSVYGAFLLSREAGGYVLAAVIAFVLGVAVTMLSLRWHKNHKTRLMRRRRS